MTFDRKISPDWGKRIEDTGYPRPDAHECCHHVAAAKAVLADRERELLELKGPCSGGHVGVGPCRLHHAHSGPCDIRPAVACSELPSCRDGEHSASCEVSL